MLGKLYKSLLCLLLLAAGSLGVSAQSATNGAIGGTIYDLTGAVIPEAAIVATSSETGQSFKAKATEAGTFRILEVKPGHYTVTITSPGYETFKTTNVTVTVGSLSDVSPKLLNGEVTSVVEVSDTTPEIQTQSQEISTTINQDQIDNLPINGRRWSSFALLTPGVVSNGDGFGLLSFRGISFLLNNSTVDGADNNQAYFSEERGRTRASYSISQAAVQEFQVNTSNYSAEYGRAAGGVINTVTKSGGNAFHGQLFFYDRDNQWGASNPYTQLVSQVPGTNTFATTNYKPKDWRKQWGFGVGGPILREKLFWFYSYDQSRRNFPGTARASDPSDTFAPADAALPAGTTCTTSVGGNDPGSYNTGILTPVASQGPGNQWACKVAGALGVNYQAGAAYYTQGLNIISSFLGAVPRSSDQVINFPRLDWKVNDRNTLTIQYNRLRASSPAGLQTQASNFYGRASFGDDFVKTDFGLLRFTTTISNSLVNEFRAQYGRDLEYETAQKPLPNELPFANNQFGTMPGASLGYQFDLQGFDIGRPYLLNRYALPDERRIQGSDGVTWSHGKHNTKIGVDINRVYDGVNNLYEEGGSYSYDYSWDFISDYLHASTGVGGTNYRPRYYSYTQGFGNGKISISTTDWNAYISDDWRITPRLTLTAGMRYEYEYIPPNPYPNIGNSAFTALTPLPETASRPDDRNNFGPRVGFAWDVSGTGKTYLRGGYGMYYGRVINANIGLAYSNSGSDKGQIALTSYSGAGCTPQFPNVLPSSQAAAATAYSAACQPISPTVAYLDPRMQNPQVHQADLALEQKLGWGSVLSITYMASFGRELPSVYDTNSPTGTSSTINYTVRNDVTPFAGGGVTSNPLPRGGAAPPLLQGSVHTYKLYTGARPKPQYYAIYAVQSHANSNYNALSAQINKRLSKGLSFLTSFTWAHALDYNPYLGTSYGSSAYLPVDPLDQRQEYGNSNLNVGKRFVFSARYSPRFNLHGWKKYVLDGWGVSPIVQAQTGLPYSATTSGSRFSSAALSGPMGAGGAARLPKFDYAGNFETERNAFNSPNKFSFDLRLSKNFFAEALGERLRFEMFAELFNVLNHQNITTISTGAYTFCAQSGAANATVANTCPSGLPSLSGLPGNNSYMIFNSNFGTYKNSNSNTIYTPRQIQIAARLHF